MKKLKNSPAFYSVLAIVCSLVICTIFILILGQNPFLVFISLLKGDGILPKDSYSNGIGQLTNFMSFVDAWAPMLLASLAIVVGMKAGLFNIGVAGQMLIAGYTATAIIGYSSLPALLAKPLAVLIGIIAGALTGALIGWLKARFRVHEVVSAIMINHTARYIISFLINSFHINVITRQSNPVSEASMLTLHKLPLGDITIDFPIGIILALITAAALYFILEKTTIGMEIRMIGLSGTAAEYAGINVKKVMIGTMAASGAIAGLTGVTYYMGYLSSIQPKLLSDLGFDAFTVCLVGNSSPIGVIFSSFFINIFDKGRTYMNSSTGFEPEVCDVLVSIILVFSACTPFLRTVLDRAAQKKAEAKKGGIKT